MSTVILCFLLILFRPIQGLETPDSIDYSLLKIHNPDYLFYFNDDTEAERYFEKNQSAKSYYLVGLYHYKKIISQPDYWGFFGKGKKRKFIEKGIKILEKSLKLYPKSPYLIPSFAVLSSLYGILSEITPYPKVLRYSKKSANYIDKAVKNDPESVEYRYLRIIVHVFFPFKYYPNLEKVILQDYQKFTELYRKNFWQLTFKAKNNQEFGFDQFILNAENVINRLMGNYYRNNVKNEEKAKPFDDKLKK